MRTVIDDVNEKIEFVDGPPPERILVILSACRSGSSVVAKAIGSQEGFITLAGECDPYYRLAKLGFPFNDDERFFGNSQHQIDLIRSLVLTELHGSYELNCRNRFRIQFHGSSHIVSSYEENPPPKYYFDGSRNKENLDPHYVFIEKPPYVYPKKCDDGHTLVLKTPTDAYHPWIWSEVFPESHIDYLWLTRNWAASVNGLIDGWECDWGFHSYRIGPFWWKFDLIPSWRKLIEFRLPIICKMQWWEANNSIKESGFGEHRMKFEDFLQTKEIPFLGLKIEEPLPIVMATDPPKPKRWHKRKEIIDSLRCPENLMADMGYSMDPDTWV